MSSAKDSGFIPACLKLKSLQSGMLLWSVRPQVIINAINHAFMGARHEDNIIYTVTCLRRVENAFLHTKTIVTAVGVGPRSFSEGKKKKKVLRM